MPLLHASPGPGTSATRCEHRKTHADEKDDSRDSTRTIGSNVRPAIARRPFAMSDKDYQALKDQFGSSGAMDLFTSNL
jgi:hypothetical protein